MAKEQQTQADQTHIETAAVALNTVEAIERAEIDIQVATARKFPRDLDVFKAKVAKVIRSSQKIAESCIYRRPVGKDEHGNEKVAEGMSIRMAEIVSSYYGNMRVATFITETSLRQVKAMAFALDLENNYAEKRDVVESTVKRTGKPYTERMRFVVARAAQSKAKRDVLFAVIPKGLLVELEAIAREVAFGDDNALQDARGRVAVWIEGLGINFERVYRYVGVKSVAEMNRDNITVLSGIKTAIEEGDVTINEAFPSLEDEDEPKGKTTERIKDKFKTTEPETPAEKAKRSPGRPRKKAAEPKTKQIPVEGAAPPSPLEGATQAQVAPTPEPESVPEPEGTPEPAAAPEPEAAPETEQVPDKYKCERCGRKFPALVNDKCPYCFGEAKEI